MKRNMENGFSDSEPGDTKEPPVCGDAESHKQTINYSSSHEED